MKVRSGGVAGTADFSNDLTLFHHFSGLDKDIGEVSIEGFQGGILVLEDDGLTITSHPIGDGDGAAIGSDDGSSGGCT